MKQINKSLMYILVTITLLPMLIPIEQRQQSWAQRTQSDCVKQIVQNAEIVAQKQLDVNQDGMQDDVIIYGSDDLYILVAINQSALGCEVILNDWLTSRLLNSGERKIVNVQQVELLDLTGDDQPELHIGLDLSTFTFRASEALHAIYKLQGESAERVFITSQCLQMSSFEFRTASDGAKLIYLDEDRRCVPPSYSREYEIYRWNAKASQFERVESGKVAKETADTFWQSALSVLLEIAVVLIAGILFAGLVILFVLKRSVRQRT